MTAAPTPGPPPDSGRAPFADASPAQVRAGLLPEDVATFDRQWQTAMSTATRSLDLTEVTETLESWRRVARLIRAKGPDGYRRLLADAEHRLHTGERAPGSVPWSQLRTELGL